ncbi:hypothetical protein GGR34_001313 [Microvirga flocculans]|uniref:Pentapeptide MXKDX repeat protein n=1 Tax=Microvirga flocculans TaxID=217168 RepID=A0A7W6IEH3_9HYPH|nr:hypothetical protein [Microvirga flocculans]MBB4039671.1 hypothetical protein [Microvirga flocculans]
MNKQILFAISGALLFMPPAYAQSGAMMPKCDEAGMKMANDSVMKMTDASKKDMAMKEMAMAKDMMMKKDEKGCMMHMEKAMGVMK